MKKLIAAVAMVAITAVGYRAEAHTEYTTRLVCPLDSLTFDYVLDGSGTTFGRRLDFKQMGPTMSPWRIGQCPKCGFVLFKREFRRTELDTLRTIVKSASYRKALKNKSTYYCYAEILRQQGAKDYEVSMVLLQASWQVDRDSIVYPLIANDCLTMLGKVIDVQLVPESFTVEHHEPSQAHMALYLSIELNRVLGRFSIAEKLLARMRPLLGEKVEYFNQLVECQRNLVADGDKQRRNMDDCRKAEK